MVSVIMFPRYNWLSFVHLCDTKLSIDSITEIIVTITKTAETLSYLYNEV